MAMKILTVVRYVLAAGIIAVMGFFGILFYFGDYGPGENLFTRTLMAGLYYGSVSALVSVLLYPHWRYGVLVAWGAALFGLSNLVRGPRSLEELIVVVIILVVPLGLSWLGAVIGGRAVRAFTRNPG